MGFPKMNLRMTRIWLLCLLLTFFNPADCVVGTEPTATSNVSTSTAPITLKSISKEFETMMNSMTKSSMAYFIRNSNVTLSPQCSSTIFKIFMELRNMKVPAIKLLDAMGMIPAGMLHGTANFMGDYDECLEVRATKSGDVAKTKAEEYYHGQYCNVEIEFPSRLLIEYNKNPNSTDAGKMGDLLKEFNFQNFVADDFKVLYGVCLPSTCTKDDLQEMLTLIPMSSFPLKVANCADGETKPFEVDQVIFLTILMFIAVAAASGTLLDALLRAKNSKFDGEHPDRFFRFLLAFSVYSNTKKLMKTKKSEGEIEVMSGLYVISSLLVILYHVYFQPFMTYYSANLYNLRDYMENFQFSVLSTMGLCIDAFFVYSGMFFVYPFFRNGKKPASINVLKVIIQRYIKLAPPFLLILGIIMLIPHWGDGPVWHQVFGVAADNARRGWWKFVLMHNNFLSVKDQTFFFMWFIACLMQISIIGAFLLWLMSKCPRAGIIATIVVGLSCNIALGVLTVQRNFPLTYAVYYNNMRENHEVTIQTSPISHVFSYGVGMLLGYYMARGEKLKLSKFQVVGGWILCVTFTLGNQWIVYAGRDGGNIILTAFYAATHRTAFSIGIAWIILACSNGYGGVLHKFLCWNGFRPLSKLTYCIYLIHYLFLAHHMASTRLPLSYSHYEVWIRYWGYTVLSYGASYVMYVTFQLPLTTIETFFRSSRKDKLEVENNCVQDVKFNEIFVVKSSDLLSEDVLKPPNNEANLDNINSPKTAEQSKM